MYRCFNWLAYFDGTVLVTAVLLNKDVSQLDLNNQILLELRIRTSRRIQNSKKACHCNCF